MCGVKKFWNKGKNVEIIRNILNSCNQEWKLQKLWRLFLFSLSIIWFQQYGLNTSYGKPSPVLSLPWPTLRSQQSLLYSTCKNDVIIAWHVSWAQAVDAIRGCWSAWTPTIRLALCVLGGSSSQISCSPSTKNISSSFGVEIFSLNHQVTPWAHRVCFREPGILACTSSCSNNKRFPWFRVCDGYRLSSHWVSCLLPFSGSCDGRNLG